MISTTQQGGVHSRLERAKGYIHDGTSLTPPPTSTADGRDVTAAGVTASSVVSPPGAASTTEMIEEESTEDVAHLLTIVADIAAREAPLPIPGDDDAFFGGHQQPPMAGHPRIRAVSMASPDLRPHPPPSTPIGGVYSLSSSPPSPQRIPPSPAVANDFRPPIRRHGAPIQERSYDDEQDRQQGQLPEQPPAYSYSSSSSSDEGGQYLWSATAGPREQRQVHMSSLTSTPPKKKKKATTHHRHRSAPAPAIATAAPRRPASTPKRRQSRPNPGGGGGGSRKVLHKKFSWKNYPEVSYLVTRGALSSSYVDALALGYYITSFPQPESSISISNETIHLTSYLPSSSIPHNHSSNPNNHQLEEFLIANRDEYLRHSTLNYTVQQKQYNNRLTERLLELAADCGYIFDEHEFSFVAVRDRIRCYYKSYVQSLKKRGIVIGYAARKAGLVTNDDLEKSACKKATIYVPSTMKH